MIIVDLLPGGLITTLFSILLCSSNVHLALTRSATLSLIALYGVSLSIYFFTLFSLLGDACLGFAQRRHLALKGDQFSFIHQARLLLYLTLSECGLWIAILVVIMTDLNITTPLLLSLGLAYIHLAIHIIQILCLTIVIYEIQTSPRRILSDRSLQNLFDKSLPSLLDLREEAKRVRMYEYYERESPRIDWDSHPPRPGLSRSSTQDNLIVMRSRSAPRRAVTFDVEPKMDQSRVHFSPDMPEVIDLTLSPPAMYDSLEK